MNDASQEGGFIRSKAAPRPFARRKTLGFAAAVLASGACAMSNRDAAADNAAGSE